MMETSQNKVQTFYRSQSFWLDSVPGSLAPRASLESDDQADVVIVGAGYSGLWTAWYLKQHAPDLDIAIVEAEIAGFGASGRNGGWCSSYLGGLEKQMGKASTREAAIALQRLMIDTVSEVGNVCATASIDCHFAHEGHVATAINPGQLERDRAHIEFMHEKGFVDDFRPLNAEEVSQRLNVEGSLGGYFMPHCAAIHPARLARGLAGKLEEQGVRIFENSAVVDFSSEKVSTAMGSVSAEPVILAAEGYSGSLPGLSRKLVPFHSTMIATEPLTDREIEDTGLSGRFTWNNGKHMSTYGQMTADRRIAFGHRGSYLYNGRVQKEFSLSDPVFEFVANELFRFFPSLRGKKVTHAWGGAMGVSRTLSPAVCFDDQSRLGWAGGFFGDGVGATNLAGRTMADVVMGRDTERSRALWVNPEDQKALSSKLWEPEPIRSIGVRARTKLMFLADAAESSQSPMAGFYNGALEKLFP
jgi:glycine/D-amino acid oxidase-like deaminating enzyme